MKLTINSKEIDYLIIENSTGRILESGEKEGVNDTFEDTYVDLNSIEIGKKPKISYNKGIYSRRANPKEPVWTELLYEVLSIS